MKNVLKNLFVLGSILVFAGSCSASKPLSVERNEPRTLELEFTGGSTMEFELSEGETKNGFTSWNCYDFGTYNFKREAVLLEVGYYINTYSDDNYKMGFLLYDGTNTGISIMYSRQGLNHRWDWPAGESFEDGSYSFIMETDGTGLYYDFTIEKEGKPKQIFTCKVRK